MKVLTFAEQNVPGSSRVVLSYIANSMFNTQQNVFMQATTGDKYAIASDDVNKEIQRDIITKLYPYLYVADKTSWY